MGIGALSKPNFLIITTDEQRYPQHWPDDWVANHLPSFARLANHGITFTNAFTAACECSPSRASYLTSTYPQTNTVIGTPGVLPLPSTLQNLATILDSVSIPTFWKGKWHLSFSMNGGYNWGEDDIANLESTYGMRSWNPPDAGTSIALDPPDDSVLGGGHANNDSRYVRGVGGTTTGWGTSAIEFLTNWDSSNGPFCLVVSLVNPHDVFLYGGDGAALRVQEAGYPVPSSFVQGIPLPLANMNDPLTTKPSVQAAYRDTLPSLPDPSSYANFYAYLHTQSDQWIMLLLDALDSAGLTDNTIIIRYADHGEMALSHGLREKMYTAYEEAIHVPLIISNPTLWPTAQQSDAIVSLIDIVPTIAGIAGATLPSTAVGSTLVPILIGTSHDVNPLGVVYTYDDVGIVPSLANDLGQIRTLRQRFRKYSVYFNEATPGVFQYELYFLDDDPYELNNLAWGSDVPAEICKQWTGLHSVLTKLLGDMGALPSSWPKRTELPCTW